MSSLPELGTTMVRVEDGMRGQVSQFTDGKRIMYIDRGEMYVAGLREHWVSESPPPLPMTDDEKMRVARVADRHLRCLMQHKPVPWWTSELEGEVFDQDLVDLVFEYLGREKNG